MPDLDLSALTEDELNDMYEDATPDGRRAIEAEMREAREEYELYLADQYAGDEEWRKK
ncbi:hypothetical protein [Pyramidobacter piscolens]|uniref:hypothetical protein n=1 Tax=Pyramidobacter piscolens TaxID=638849 RepID=UPI001FCAD4CA|nr:hypothetical protein [Pyramidobacter piscolens]BDF78605.1 hypothetical protein CE91St28_13990 [Pyramidobacter piscolens]